MVASAFAPRVAFVLPVFNAERFVADAVKSILGQTFSDFELVIIDDGSNDRSLDVIRSFGDRRIRLIENGANLGLIRSLNRGIECAGAPLIARMDADDLADPQRLERQVTYLDRHAAVVGLSGSMQIIDEVGRPGQIVAVPTDDARIRDWLRRGENPLHHPASTFRRAAFVAAGRYRGVFAHAEDFDLWLRLAEHGELANLPDVVLRHRVHAGQVSFLHIEQQVLSATAALVASQERAEGRPDPFVGGGVVDRKSLADLGVDLADVERTIIARHAIAADAALAGGRADDALEAARSLAAVVFSHHRAGRDAAFQSEWIRARSHWSQARFGRSAWALLRAARWPLRWLSYLARALARRLGRVQEGEFRG